MAVGTDGGLRVVLFGDFLAVYRVGPGVEFILVAGAAQRERLVLDRPLADLTARETDMLVLIGNGMSTQNLADRFAVSPNTIKWHLKNIYEKLGIRNRMQAVNAARRLGLIT